MKHAAGVCSVHVRPTLVVLTSAWLLFVGACPARAQSSAASGRLEGYVADPSGGSVPSATVAVRNTATGESFTQQADDHGHFLFLYLAPAHYDVSIEKSGFAALTIHDVVINVGTTSELWRRESLSRRRLRSLIQLSPLSRLS
jgi:hypothetical protein